MVRCMFSFFFFLLVCLRVYFIFFCDKIQFDEKNDKNICVLLLGTKIRSRFYSLIKREIRSFIYSSKNKLIPGFLLFVTRSLTTLHYISL